MIAPRAIPPCMLSLVVALAALAPACGPASPDDGGDDTAADETAADDGPAIGGDYAEPDAPSDPALGCGEDCDIPVDPVVEVVTPTDPPPGDGAAHDPASDTPDAPTVALDGPAAGSTMVTKAYAGFHSHASNSSSLLSVAPHGGVAGDALHPQRNPTGIVPPGKNVTLVQASPSSGYLKVRFDGVTGWVKSSKLVWRDPSLSRVQFALQPSVRNAFFKHQILRSKWNKDGPLHSGNCAPTSLAMAVNILGKESASLSVEQSIHRVRRQYDGGLHESEGTTRGEIHEAAADLGLHVHGLTTDLAPSAALARLDEQLAAGRLVVLQGQPGKESAGPTTYEHAFTAAYQAAIANGASLYHSSYNYDGRHSIVVLGKDGDGKYVVGDPISEIGFLSINAAAMKDFMTRFTGERGTGNAVWR